MDLLGRLQASLQATKLSLWSDLQQRVEANLAAQTTLAALDLRPVCHVHAHGHPHHHDCQGGHHHHQQQQQGVGAARAAAREPAAGAALSCSGTGGAESHRCPGGRRGHVLGLPGGAVPRGAEAAGGEAEEEVGDGASCDGMSSGGPGGDRTSSSSSDSGNSTSSDMSNGGSSSGVSDTAGGRKHPCCGGAAAAGPQAGPGAAAASAAAAAQPSCSAAASGADTEQHPSPFSAAAGLAPEARPRTSLGPTPPSLSISPATQLPHASSALLPSPSPFALPPAPPRPASQHLPPAPRRPATLRLRCLFRDPATDSLLATARGHVDDPDLRLRRPRANTQPTAPATAFPATSSVPHFGAPMISTVASAPTLAGSGGLGAAGGTGPSTAAAPAAAAGGGGGGGGAGGVSDAGGTLLFVEEQVLGRGAFGLVTLVTDAVTGQSYALKRLLRSRISIKHVMQEQRAIRMLMAPPPPPPQPPSPPPPPPQQPSLPGPLDSRGSGGIRCLHQQGGFGSGSSNNLRAVGEQQQQAQQRPRPCRCRYCMAAAARERAAGAGGAGGGGSSASASAARSNCDGSCHGGSAGRRQGGGVDGDGGLEDGGAALVSTGGWGRALEGCAGPSFCVRQLGTFQDEQYLYLLMEYCPGGDLDRLARGAARKTLVPRRSWLANAVAGPAVAWRGLGEEAARFYAAGVVLALKELHARHIVYRDLKPGNVLLDGRGYPRLADFGMAKALGGPGGRAASPCGTLDYMAPEVVKIECEHLARQGGPAAASLLQLGSSLDLATDPDPLVPSGEQQQQQQQQPRVAGVWARSKGRAAVRGEGAGPGGGGASSAGTYGLGVDWWSFGAVLYVLLTGCKPFCSPEAEAAGEDPSLVLYRIMNPRFEVALPAYLSPAARDLLRRLLVRQPRWRLGCGGGGAVEVMEHPWFGGFDWAAYARRDMEPPRPAETVLLPEDQEAASVAYFLGAGEEESAARQQQQQGRGAGRGGPRAEEDAARHLQQQRRRLREQQQNEALMREF